MPFGSPAGTFYASFMRRYFGITDPQGLVIPPEILPVINLEDDRTEFEFLLGVTLGAGFCDTGASAAGEVPSALLMNPVGSDVICVVESMRMLNITAIMTYDYRFVRGATPAGFTVAGSGPRDLRDTRLIGTGGTACKVLFDVEAAGTTGGGVFESFTLGVGEKFEDDRGGIILAPGSGWLVTGRTNAVNTARVSFRWRERTLRDGET